MSKRMKLFKGAGGIFTVVASGQHGEAPLYYVCKVEDGKAVRIDNLPLASRKMAEKYARLEADMQS